MDNNLKLSDFDILGIINLKDVQGIERFVTPIIQDGKIEEYLSRSKEYYSVKTMSELAITREELRSILTDELSKRNFVIIENMLNCSAKVYFKKFENYILSGKSKKELDELRIAEECLNEDMQNLLVILENEGKINIGNSRLPSGNENCARRAIEMDNKAILYIFSKVLKLNKNSEDIEVLNPGYGSMYIGPMLKCMYGYNYTKVLKSKYIEETMNTQDVVIDFLVSSNRVFMPNKTVLVLDDNVGTGETMKETKERLGERGVTDFLLGAVQFNWRNYYRVAAGEKKDIRRFEIDEVDILSPFNFPGHKLFTHAIDLLHSSGKEYIDYLNYKNFRRDDMNDIQGALYRGLLCARAAKLELKEGYYAPTDETYLPKELLEEYKSSPHEVTNPISKEIIQRIIEEIDKVNEIKNDKEDYSR